MKDRIFVTADGDIIVFDEDPWEELTLNDGTIARFFRPTKATMYSKEKGYES